MTSQKDQIQSLITEIDGVLQKASPRLPWVMTGEVAQQRQVLQRVREYLVGMQRKLAIPDSYSQSRTRQDLMAHDIYYQPTPPVYPAGASAQEFHQSEATAQQVLQAVVQEMNYLRASLMQPMQADLESLRQQREILQQEIRQLELQKQQSNQQWVTEFLQVVMGRLQEHVSQQVAQGLAAQGLPQSASGLSGPASFPLANPQFSLPGQQLEQLQSLQANSDQLLMNLDTTLRTVFEALQRDIHAYQDSLARGLEKMHNLGQQGEVMVSSLVNQLHQQVSRETPALPGSQQFAGAELPAARLVPPAPPAQAAIPPSVSSRSLQPVPSKSTPAQSGAAGLGLPYPGTEIPLTAPVSPAASNPIVPQPVLPSLEASSSLDSLSLGDLDLDNLDVSQVANEDLDALLNLETEISLEEAGLTASDAAPLEEDTSDIDAALKLLEQLSAELDDQAVSVADVESRLDEVMGSAATAPPLSLAADPVRDELDEFYESLFGAETATDAADETPDDELTDLLAPDTAVVSDLPSDVALELEAPPPEGVVALPEGETGANGGLALESEVVTLPTAVVEESLEGFLLEEPPADLDVDYVPHHERDILPDAMMPELPLASQAALETIEVAEVPAETITPAAPDTPDVIEALTDLFDELEREIDRPSPSPAQPAPAPEVSAPSSEPAAIVDVPVPNPGQPPSDSPVGMTEDLYIPAAPDESLLPATGGDSMAGLNLWLDESTLNRLSEDLSTLEIREGDSSPAASEPEPAAALPVESSPLTTAPTAVEPSPTGTVGELVDAFSAPEASEDDASAAQASSLEAAFTLEGLDDLFADTEPVTPTDPAAVADTPFTLEGVDDLFADLPQGEATATASSATDSALPFTLEGMDELFADLPPVDPATPVPPPATNPADALPFTLEGLDDLLAELPPPPTAAVSATGVPPEAGVFTLEGMDDLFGGEGPLDTPPEGSNPRG